MSDPLPRSPLAPATQPDLPDIPGCAFAVAETGIKYKGRPDLMLAHMVEGTSIAGVFTRSQTRSAAVLDCQAKIGGAVEGAAAILVNAGNANAFTGKSGMESVDRLVTKVSTVLNVPASRIFTSSTGVIGEKLPDDRISAALSDLATALGPNGLSDAAEAIRTTDTYSKVATETVILPQGDIQIAGIAKGSGMIAPDMATMLVYIFTDAQCDQAALQDIVARQNARTFNCITVDSDTSTSDTLLVAATGTSSINVAQDPTFEAALGRIMENLAHQVVRDGEGATKFIEVSVRGAISDTDARQHAMSIANSPLVKTAIAGEDPNWGRIVMAIGKSGAAADRDKITIRFGDILVAENGWVADSYTEEDGAAYMKNDTLRIEVDLGLAEGAITVWTCDLTHGYISINADYRS